MAEAQEIFYSAHSKIIYEGNFENAFYHDCWILSSIRLNLN